MSELNPDFDLTGRSVVIDYVGHTFNGRVTGVPSKNNCHREPNDAAEGWFYAYGVFQGRPARRECMYLMFHRCMIIEVSN